MWKIDELNNNKKHNYKKMIMNELTNQPLSTSVMVPFRAFCKFITDVMVNEKQRKTELTIN